ncbi:hypothetical protein HaLaN_30887 [Haematococcus lacustris]|uniref:Uncharacterized protein n=1 Tax=Haematococcus lacustris TaxID=44745 RepID=A0A6A0AGC4_HAELA|nr:hypothetical protein HaLaN_30887 [Haematococcus lacustris]
MHTHAYTPVFFQNCQADAGHEGFRTITWLVTQLVPTGNEKQVTQHFVMPKSNARVRIVTKSRPRKQAFGSDRYELRKNKKSLIHTTMTQPISLPRGQQQNSQALGWLPVRACRAT